LGVVWIDAHGDLHSPYTTPSGNMHGMPLAISLADDNLEMKCNDPDALAVEKWNELKNLGGISPKIDPDDLVFFAVRDTEKPEDFLRKKHGIRNFEVSEIRNRGIEACLQDAKDRLKNCDLIYVSFDVDSMDCDLVSKGTGTPVKDGLTPEEALEIMQGFINDERLICLEMLEINPLLDNKGNVMAETAAKILDKLVSTYLK
jgi:arginase